MVCVTAGSMLRWPVQLESIQYVNALTWQVIVIHSAGRKEFKCIEDCTRERGSCSLNVEVTFYKWNGDVLTKDFLGLGNIYHYIEQNMIIMI